MTHSLVAVVLMFHSLSPCDLPDDIEVDVRVVDLAPGQVVVEGDAVVEVWQWQIHVCVVGRIHGDATDAGSTRKQEVPAWYWRQEDQDADGWKWEKFNLLHIKCGLFKVCNISNNNCNIKYIVQVV